ncbi:hypothetical protein SLS60_010266 [Paraconiothyrium brasiliense]|uniref:Uncharacterized protein n=1 Tax=Paraconiothyrium brasiliense TaxID=300254 RepID=A0ABR3QQT0_9PLEO
MAPPANPVRLHELRVFTGTFSWSPNILKYNIEISFPGYKSYDPATWPRIPRDMIRRFDGRPYDGSMILPAGIAAFDEDVMDLFLGNVAKDWAFDILDSTNTRQPISRGFKDFPFMFTYEGTRKKKTTSCYISSPERTAYIELLGPGASNLGDTEEALVVSGHELPKSSEEAYQEMLRMLENHQPELEETRNTPAAVAQETPEAEGADAVSQAAYQQCESAFTELIELAGSQIVADAVSQAAYQQCEGAITELIDLASSQFRAVRTKLDEKVKGLRRLEQRAIAAEEKNKVLEQDLQTREHAISDLNCQIMEAKKLATKAQGDILVMDRERIASERQGQDLEMQLRSRDAELAAAKAAATQADERLMKLWGAMEKRRNSSSRKRKEVNEPPALMEAGDSRNSKRARQDQRPYVQSEHDDDESDELEEGEIREVDLPTVKTELQ